MKLPMSDSLKRRLTRILWEIVAEMLAEASDLAKQLASGKSIEDILGDEPEPKELEEKKDDRTAGQPL